MCIEEYIQMNLQKQLLPLVVVELGVTITLSLDHLTIENVQDFSLSQMILNLLVL